MFYLVVDEQIISINPERIYTMCPRCAKLFPVDLEEIIKDGGDLNSTQVFCEECSKNK